ncbi:MAG: 30S ribosomal protein S9 [Parcubacteria group bacterium]
MAELRYTEAVGRRKTAVARVRLTKSAKLALTINEREFEVYFPTAELRKKVKSVFEGLEEGMDKFKITAKLRGGGIASQAEALRLGIARALIEIDSGLRTKLKQKGYLKRDPRAKERRKFGLKKARKAPQWSKR